VAIRYLLQEYDPALIDRYVKHSLDHERRLLEAVNENRSSQQHHPSDRGSDTTLDRSDI
jgi:hypothetical protein